MKKLLIVSAVALLSLTAEAASATPPHITLRNAMTKLRLAGIEIEGVRDAFPEGSVEFTKAMNWWKAIGKLQDEMAENFPFYEHSDRT